MGRVPSTSRSAESMQDTDTSFMLISEWTAGDLPPTLGDRLALVAPARTAIRTVVAGLWQVPQSSAHDIIQIFSELLANALQHGKPPIRVALDRGSTGAVTIAVSDKGAALPEFLRDVPEDAERLRGLVIVDALAQAWDEHLHPEGAKTDSALVVPPGLPCS